MSDKLHNLSLCVESSRAKLWFMLILGIESSCDETGVALVRTHEGADWPQLLAQHLHTQAAMHEAYGGVVPELASRDHIRRVVPLVEQVMASAQQALSEILM